MNRLQTRITKTVPVLLALSLLWFGCASNGMAAPDADTLQKFKASKVGQPTSLWIFGDQSIIHAECESLPDDETLKKQAAEWAEILAGDNSLRQVSIIFLDKTSAHFKRITIEINKGQPISLDSQGKPANEGEQIAVSEGQKFVLSGQDTAQVGPPTKLLKTKLVVVQSEGVLTIPTAGYLLDRPVLVDHIGHLQSKGVGVKPYMDELARLDGCYVHGDTKSLNDGVERLKALVTKNETTLEQLSAQKAQAQTAARLSSQHTDKAGSAGLTRSVSSFTGSGSTVFWDLIKDHIKQTLGDDATSPGPFALERYRVAVRIKELEQGGRNVRDLRAQYHKIEDMVKTKVTSMVPQVASDLRYLQRQVGLPELGKNDDE